MRNGARIVRGSPMTVGLPHGQSAYEPESGTRWTTWGTVSSGFCEIELRGDRLESVGHLAPFLALAKPSVYLGILDLWQRSWSPFQTISSPRWTPRRAVGARPAAPLCGISPTRACANAARAEQQRCDRCSATPRPMGTRRGAGKGDAAESVTTFLLDASVLLAAFDPEEDITSRHEPAGRRRGHARHARPRPL
jgi:hypothetical protein